MATARPVARQLARRAIARQLGSPRYGAAFGISKLNPSLWLDPESGVSTSGGRKLTAADKAHFQIASNADLQTADVDFWSAAWVYFDDKAADQVLISRYQTSNREHLLWYWKTGDRFRFNVGGPNGEGAVNADALGSPQAGKWYFVLAWHDSVNDTVNIRVNNGTTDSVAHTGGASPLSAPFAVGQAEGGKYLNGRIARPAFGKSPTGGIASVIDTISTTLYNRGNGAFYGDLTAAQISDWGIKAYYNSNERGAIGEGLIDAHSTHDLAFTAAEMLTDPGFETWTTTTDLTSWGEAVGGTSTVNQEATTIDGGTCAVRFDLDASGSFAQVSQGVLTLDNDYDVTGRSRNNGVSGGLDIYLGSGNSSANALTSAYANVAKSGKCAGSTSLTFRGTGVSGVVYLDNVSCKAASIKAANGPTSATASDEVGSNHGALTGFTATQEPEAWGTDVPAAIGSGYCLSLDGVDDYVRVKSDGGILVVPCTISMWVNAAAGSRYLYAEASSSAVNPILGINMNPDGTVRAVIRNDAGTINAVNSTTIVGGNGWHHVAATFNASGHPTIWVNGTAEGTASTNNASGGRTSTHVDIGAINYSGGNNYTSGKIDEVRVFDSVLASSQIVELSGGANPTGATAVSRWPFDDGPQTSDVTDGDSVLYWESKDSGRKLARQVNAASRPIYKENIQNEKPVLRFDGADDYLTLDASGIGGVSGFTAFVVAKFNTTAGSQYLLGGQNNKSLLQVSSGVAYSRVDTNNYGSTAFADTGWNIWTVQFDGSGATNADRLKRWLNGAKQALTFTGTIPATAAAGEGLSIGKVHGSSSSYFNGDLGKPLLVPRVLSALEITRVHKLLSKEYGIPVV